jgi:hypothetical protein
MPYPFRFINNEQFLFTILSFTIYRSAMPLGSAKNLLVSSAGKRTKTVDNSQLRDRTRGFLCKQSGIAER